MSLVWNNDTMRFHEEPITKVWERLYLGCFYDAMQIRSNNPYGINAVINLTHDAIVYDHKFDVDIIPMHDGHEVDVAVFWQVMDMLRNYMEKGKTVLVHCHAGQSRSVSMVAAYLCLVGFLNLDDAVQYIKEKRPVILPHFRILNSVKKHLKIWPHDGSLGKPVNG